MTWRPWCRAMMICVALLTAGCATPRQVDYTAFRESRPASLLVLPPINASVDANASAAVLAQATLPLAESGYYVIPVGVMDETFKRNGLSAPEDIHALSTRRLHEIFGADAALYMTVKQYGASYAVLASSVTVAIDASLIDLRTGRKLWDGEKQVVYSSGSSGGLVGMLIQAVVDQIVNTLSDRSYSVAGMTNQMLLAAGQEGGLLYGPRSPLYVAQP